MDRNSGRVLAAGLIAALAGPAVGQIWIGQIAGEMAARSREHQCMIGALATDKETAEALAPSQAAMRTYWAAVHERDGANVLRAFHEGSKARWRHGSAELKGPALAAVTDPVARTGATLAPEPRQFVRAGDSGTAHGVWEVRAATGETVGVYQAIFRRLIGVWKLQEIEVDPASVDPATFAPYCHKPGDVAVYQARLAEDAARRAAKEARKKAEHAAPASSGG